MIQISDTCEPNDANVELAVFVMSRLPDGYPLTDRDVKWLEVCGSYLEGEATNYSVLAATKHAFNVHQHAFHIDPFELLIDANICDPSCEPL